MSGYKRIFVFPILLLLCLLSPKAAAQSPGVVELTADQEQYLLGLKLEILEDKEKQWTIEDVTSSKIAVHFVPSQEETPGFGFTDSAYWVRFHVENETDQMIPWLLAVDSNLFYIDVYMPAADADGYEVTQTGMARPYDNRAIDHPRFLFDFSIPPGEAQTIYARFESESAMNISLAIWSATAVVRDDLVSQTMNGVLYGVLLIMAAYNFFLFISLRDISYLYYSLFLFTLFFSYLINNGAAHKYIWPEQGRINAVGGQFSFTLLLIFVLLFSDTFLRLKQYAPGLRKALLVVTGALCLMLPLQWISLLWSARPVLILTIVTFVIIVASGVLVWRKGYQPARYFLLAWLLLLFSFVLFVLSIAGILPLTLFSIAGTQIGIIVLVLTLSLALADRISAYRKEKEEAQLALLQEQQEALGMKNEYAYAQQKINKSLAAEFEQRTRELSFAQEQINSLFEHSPLAIGTASMDGRVLTANSAMKALFGYPDDEIFAANIMNFFPDAEVRQAIMEKLFTEKLIRVPTLPLQHRDGSIIYTNLTESILSRGDQDVLLGIVDDITEQVLAEQALQAKAEETAVAEERNRIARELHDSVTQSLYTSSLIAEALPKVWDTHPDEARRSLEELRIMSVGALAEMRTLLLELRPGELADRDLGELLQQLTDAMTARTDLPITTTLTGGCPIPTDVQIACYRIAQEALNNISKHARAERAWIYLNCREGQVTLLIGDDGRGFRQRTGQPHQMGLIFMQERSRAIGADLSINSDPESGTEIKMVWHRPPAEEKE